MATYNVEMRARVGGTFADIVYLKAHWNNIEGLPSTFTPTSHTHGVTDLTATGTKDGTKFLRDDNTWQLPAGGGGGGWTSIKNWSSVLTNSAPNISSIPLTEDIIADKTYRITWLSNNNTILTVFRTSSYSFAYGSFVSVSICYSDSSMDLSFKILKSSSYSNRFQIQDIYYASFYTDGAVFGMGAIAVYDIEVEA